MFTDTNSLISDPNPPIWDKENALSRLGGDESILRQIVAIYLKQTDKGFVLLEEAIKTKKTKDILVYSHALKGSAANVSAYAFIKIAQKIENSMKADDLSTVDKDFKDLKKELQSLVTELSTYVEA